MNSSEEQTHENALVDINRENDYFIFSKLILFVKTQLVLLRFVLYNIYYTILKNQILTISF
jgi:hypothetical protein